MDFLSAGNTEESIGTANLPYAIACIWKTWVSFIFTHYDICTTKAMQACAFWILFSIFTCLCIIPQSEANIYIVLFHSDWASNKSLEGMFHIGHKFVDELISGCSLKNETAIKKAENGISELIYINYEKENTENFIPSDEDSVSSHRLLITFNRFFILILHSFQPFVELILNVTNKCSTKFNTSSFSIVIGIMKSHHSPHSLQYSNLILCYIHCMFSELGFVRSWIFSRFSEFCHNIPLHESLFVFDKVNETGLNEPWAGVIVFKHEKFLEVTNELVLKYSKCSAEFNELPDNYLDDALKEFESSFNEIDRKISSVHGRESL